jgi:predicted RNA-binding protein Jag
MIVNSTQGSDALAKWAQSLSLPKEAAKAGGQSEDTVSISDAAKSAFETIKSLTQNVVYYASPQGKATLMQMGRGVLNVSPDKPLDLGNALVAVIDHYDKLFSEMSGKKAGCAKYSGNDWDSLNDVISKYLKENVEKMNKSANIDIDAAIARRQKTADTFLSTFSSNYSNGVDAALKSAREAVKELPD